MSKPKLKSNALQSDLVAGYVFVSPWILGFILFTVAPLIASLYLSFTNYDILSPPKWIGFENYTRLFTNDERFWSSVKATLLYVCTAVPFKVAFALFIAMLLDTKLKLVGLYRTIFYLPTVIGGSVAVAVMWRQMFGINGAVNSFLQGFGLTNLPSWIMEPATAMWTLVILAGWQFGSSMLIFLAGLKQIPAGLKEAALIDGANAWHRFKNITVPLLTPVIFFNLIMQIIAGFKVFNEGLLITNGGPFDKTLFYALYLYEKSFLYFDMGYGSAMAWILLLIVGFLTFIIFRSSARWVYYESKGG